MTFETQTLTHEAVNILLVDDQTANLINREVLLKDQDENLILAKSAKQALKLLLKFDVAVVLINVGLRDSDGYELCKTIRQHPGCEWTSIILISTIPITASDCLKGYQSGAMDYIALPAIPELLRTKVGLLARLYRHASQEEKLRKADQRKNHFLAALAHELRDPLAPIASAASVLRMKVSLDKDIQWIAEAIERQVVSLKRLIDDLLDIGRIAPNRMVIQREKVELASILTAVSTAARPAIEQRGHELTLQFPKEPVYLFADPIRLIEAFGNLLENSLKFASSGGRIALVAESDGAVVAIRITDYGVDNSEQEMPQISEPLDPLDGSFTKPQGGVSGGLSLVWQLVEMHGGRVELSSVGPGKNRAFIVYLPVLVELQVDTGRSDPPQPAATLRILIAEDNPDSAALLAMSLRLEGHIVEIALDGMQALEIAATFCPQVALLDIGMPKVNGYDLAKKIRSLDWSKDTLLIAQTGWGRAEDWERAVESGFNVHLTKPVDYTALSKILDSFINRPPDQRPDK